MSALRSRLCQELFENLEVGAEDQLILTQTLGVEHPGVRERLTTLSGSEEWNVAQCAIRQLRRAAMPRGTGVPSEGVSKGEERLFITTSKGTWLQNARGVQVEGSRPEFEPPRAAVPRLTVLRTAQNTLCCIAEGLPRLETTRPNSKTTISIESGSPTLTTKQKQAIALFLLPESDQIRLLQEVKEATLLQDFEIRLSAQGPSLLQGDARKEYDRILSTFEDTSSSKVLRYEKPVTATSSSTSAPWEAA
jgi:hypothetical protein